MGQAERLRGRRVRLPWGPGARRAPASDRAILAALAAFEGAEVDDAGLERIREATEGTDAELSPEEDRLLGVADALLGHYRSGVVQPAALRVRVCQEIAALVRGARRLAMLAEFGEADKNIVPSARDLQCDVRAAELRDVVGLSWSRIGEVLGFEQSGSDKIKNDNHRAREAAGRARTALDAALGGRWQDYAQHLKERRDQRRKER